MPAIRVQHEKIIPGQGQSFRVLVSPGLNDQYFWHFHPEYEIVYVESAGGIRHVGDHISRYEGSDLVMIGPDIPHLNFDYGVQTGCEQVVVQMRADFLGEAFMQLPETEPIRRLFARARQGLSFGGQTREVIGKQLKQLPGLSPFDQLIALLRILDGLGLSTEIEELKGQPLHASASFKSRERLSAVYRLVEERYQHKIELQEVAALVHLSIPAFCRFFKKMTRMTFTQFLNRYRVSQAKNLLLQDQTVTEACYQTGFENLSYFNRSFRRIAGDNPSVFKRKHLGV